MLDLEHIKATLAAARHPEWFVSLDHQCGDGFLAVFDADPDGFSFEAQADAALVCGGISPDDEGRAKFIAAAPTHVALLLAEVVGLREQLLHSDTMVATLEGQCDELAAQVEANRVRYTDARRERDEAREDVERLRGELTRRCGIVYASGSIDF